MTTKTLAIATGELLRSRPATKMPGYVALERVQPCQKPVLWHVVQPDEVARRVFEWELMKGLMAAVEDHAQSKRANPFDVCPMCKSDAGFSTDTDDGLERCVDCGCH